MSARVPSPLGSLAVASLTKAKIVTKFGRSATNNECPRALVKPEAIARSK